MLRPSADALVGCFTRGQEALALPIKHLQEVLPKPQLHAIPSQCPTVVGAIMLRGHSIAVLDLAQTQNTEQSPDEGDCVVVVRFDGYLLGLLANQLLGLYSVEEDNLTACRHDGLIKQNLTLPTLNLIVSVLDIERIYKLPNLPVADFTGHRNPAQQSLSSTCSRSDTGKRLMMLMRNQGLDLAIDPTDVETTIANPSVIPQDLSSDYFVGVIEYRGNVIPAIDLNLLLGMNNITHESRKQAFVLRTAKGALAFLIEAVLEIESVQDQIILNLPQLPMKGFEYFQAVIANESLRPALVNKIKPLTQQHLVIDATKIKRLPALLDLTETYQKAAFNTASDQSSDQPQTGSGEKFDKSEGAENHANDRPLLITYEIQDICATPINQIDEVLPYQVDINMEGQQNNELAMLGLLTNRGQTIPVLDLKQLILGTQAKLTSKSSVLVVRQGAHACGFAIERLNSIEKATWQPKVPLLREEERPMYKPNMVLQEMAELNLAQGRMMVDVIDLYDVMRASFELVASPSKALSRVAQTSGNAIDTEVHAT